MSCRAIDRKMSGAAFGSARHELCRGDRHLLAELEQRPVDARDVEQSAEVERGGEAVHLLVGDAELPHEQVEGDLVHVVGDLQPDRRAEAPAQELSLERLDEVLRLVLVDLHVFVAGHPELVMIEHLHAGEQVAEVVRDEVLEGDEAQQPTAVIRQLHETGQHRGHLEARELLFTGLRMPDAHRQVERQARDVGERVRRIDGEGHEHGEDLVREDLLHASAVLVPEVGPGLHVDAGFVEGGFDHIGEGGRVACLQHVRPFRDRLEHIGGRPAHVRGHGESRDDAAFQPRHAHHEEFVEVAREDGEKVRPLEQRQGVVLGEFEHSGVEREPAQFPVEVAVGGKAPVVDPTRLVVVFVVNEIRADGGLPDIGVAVHGPHHGIPICSGRCGLSWAQPALRYCTSTAWSVKPTER